MSNAVRLSFVVRRSAPRHFDRNSSISSAVTASCLARS